MDRNRIIAWVIVIACVAFLLGVIITHPFSKSNLGYTELNVYSGVPASYTDKRENVRTVYAFDWQYGQSNWISVETSSYVNDSAFPENQNVFNFPVYLNASYNVGSESSIYGGIQFNVTTIYTTSANPLNPFYVALSIKPLS
ncbi:MAG: hypothetical protein ABSB89_06985 [Candidatus Bathyarchaeia archaeon]|jgi:hypothetical protein